MPAPEPGPEWVLSGANPRLDSATESELSKAAQISVAKGVGPRPAGSITKSIR